MDTNHRHRQMGQELPPLSGPSTFSQIQALVGRFLRYLLRYKISTMIRLLFVPGLCLGVPLYFLLTRTNSNPIEPIKSLTSLAALCLFLPIQNQVNRIVSDKASQFKSLMFMMGLKRTPHYLSTFINYAISTLHIILLGMILSISGSFEGTPGIVTASVFILFWLQLYSFSFLIASLMTSTRYTSLFSVIIFLDLALSYLIDLAAASMIDSSWARLFVFMISLSPFQSLRIFCGSWVGPDQEQTFHITVDKYTKLGDIHETNGMIATAMSFWTVALLVLGLWIEEVCPWKKDTEIKGPLFCFDLCRTKKASPESSSDDKCMVGSKYFQKCSQDKTTGLKIIGLTKAFNSIPAVKDVSLRIFHGETTLLLGHNGAGKTTLMNMLLGQLMPDEGCVERPSDCGIGVCPQSSIIDADMTVVDHLKLFSNIKASSWTLVEQDIHINHVLEEVGLSLHAHKYPPELSGGMLRKLSLGMALIGGSKILILDEPSSGLDPDSRMFIWNAIRRSRTNRTVLLSSQHMEEADYLGDRIAIMSEGQIVCCGSALFLKNLFGTGYKLRVECLASEQSSALNLIRRFYPKARVSEDDQMMYDGNQNKIISSVIALTPDKTEQSSQDRIEDEKKLIELLEYLEQNRTSTPIKSFGPRSSTIEDVLLNTNRFFNDEKSKKGSSKNRIEIDTAETLIDAVVKAPRKLVASHHELFNNQMTLLKALLIKNLQQYRHDWKFLIFYRVILTTLMIYISISNFDSSYPNSGRTVDIMSILESRLPMVTIVATLVNYPIKERCSKFKSMVLTTNADYNVYWLSHLITDVLSSSVIIIIVLNILFATCVHLQPGHSIIVIHLIITFAGFLLTFSGALIAYVISYMVQSEDNAIAKAQLILSLSLIIDFSCYIIMLISSLQNLINPTETFWFKLSLVSDKIFIAILPSDAFAYILYGLRADGYYTKPEDDFPKQITPLAYGFIALSGQIVVYTLLIYLFERFNLDPAKYISLKRYYYHLKNCLCSVPRVRRSQDQQLDNEVVEESISALKLVNSGSQRIRDDATVCLVAGDLCKSYLPGVPVIDHLSFTVKRAECFGLLGVNGAGKSTTFSMVVADLKPDSGNIWLNGRLNSSNLNEYRSQIAYDPQSSPNVALNCTEALTLMARLRRVKENAIPEVVIAIMQVLEMAEHAKKTIHKLSGGTKRKLSLAMAIIGNPSLLALDEPTAGVDPIARRKVWSLLRTLRIKLGCSIIISSHAMEECEAICDRISIMARGRLRCLGTFMQLQAKYANGCIVKITMTEAARRASETERPNMATIVADIKHNLEVHFRSAVKLDDTNENSAVISIECDLLRSKLFRIMHSFGEKYKNILYIINDLSLENVFKKIASENQSIQW